MRRPMEMGKKIGEPFFSKGLKGPLTDSEMQKVVDFYLKNSKVRYVPSRTYQNYVTGTNTSPPTMA